MQERLKNNSLMKEVSLGSGKQTRKIVLIDNEGLLTKIGKEAHELVFLNKQIKNHTSRYSHFSLDEVYLKDLRRREEELFMNFGLSDKRRTQKKQIERINRTLIDAGYPHHWINVNAGPIKSTGMDATVVYRRSK